jgi:hypothetical protein
MYVSTDQDWRTLVDRTARHYLDMSVDEFFDAWERGRLENLDQPEVLPVVLLLPVGR